MQREPLLVVSTQCRACRANFKVADGAAITRPLAMTRIAGPSPEPEIHHHATARLKLFSKPPSATTTPQGWRRIFAQKAKPLKDVVCFKCSRAFTAVAKAQSPNVPAVESTSASATTKSPALGATASRRRVM